MTSPLHSSDETKSNSFIYFLSTSKQGQKRVTDRLRIEFRKTSQKKAFERDFLEAVKYH